MTKKTRADGCCQCTGPQAMTAQAKRSTMMTADEIARGLTDAQRRAASEGRVTECPYNHPRGTRGPNCSEWPFKKGGAAAFISAVRQIIQEQNNADV